MIVRVVASSFIAVLVVLVGASALIYAVFYYVAATEPHWSVTTWLLETARTRSIEAHSAWIQVLPGLDDPAKVLIGVDHYAAHCAVCHGAPGVPKGDIVRAFIHAARSGQSRAVPQRGAFLDRQARHQDDRHASLE
jgi:hypothetical protein